MTGKQKVKGYEGLSCVTRRPPWELQSSEEDSDNESKPKEPP